MKYSFEIDDSRSPGHLPSAASAGVPVAETEAAGAIDAGPAPVGLVSTLAAEAVGSANHHHDGGPPPPELLAALAAAGANAISNDNSNADNGVGPALDGGSAPT